MIYERRWEKKKREMSTKNNVFFNTYLESRIFLNAIIFSEVKRIEENNMNNEISELRAELTLRQLREAHTLAKPTDELNLSKEPIIPLTSVISELTPSDSTLIVDDNGLDRPVVLDAVVNVSSDSGSSLNELTTEELIKSRYSTKIKNLMSCNVNLLYSDYRSNFSDFNFKGKLSDIFDSMDLQEDLLESKVINSKYLLKNFINLYNFSCSDNSTLSPTMFLFF
jgi:hypothetical protein